MKVIYSGKVVSDSNGCYIVSERLKCDGSEGWNGNVYQYVFDKFDYDEACVGINANYEGTVNGLPKGGAVLAICDVPMLAYWCEEE